jgi:amino acid adenylation domain-containing protein
MTIIRVFEEQVRRRPDSPALTFGDREWTYSELNSAAETLASLLERRGIGPGARVGLCFTRSLEQIAAIIAVLKVGAAYIPIDPTYPTERIRHIITDSGMELIVTGDVEDISLPLGDLAVISFHAAADDLRPESITPRREHPGPDNLAYIIYTSGSTGLPKGAMITHRNLRWYIDTAAGLFGYDEGDTWVLIHSYGFDVSVWEIWGSLGCGGTLVIVPEDMLADTPRLIGLIEQRGVTVLSMTPAAFYAYLDADRAFGRRTAPTLRLVFIGGERLDFPRLMPWFKKYGDERPAIHNMYGPTETTIYVTTKHVTIPDAEPGKGSSIGVPLPGTRIILAGERGVPVPEGQDGEILIAGDGVGRGYHNRPSLTREKFLPDRERPGCLVYRSGDLGKRLPGGEIEFLGRIDRQLKIRGHRVEPGEIEAVLRQHPSVLDAAVVPQTVGEDTVRLIGYVVPSHDQTVDESGIRVYMQFRLPHHMVCSRIISIPSMPLNPHGKVDRDALPLPDPDRGDQGGAYIGPRDERERLLAEVFSEVTGVPQVGIRDNFFSLGGNSLSAVRLAARIRESMGIWVAIRTIFAHPTIEGLSGVLDLEEGNKDAPVFDYVSLDRDAGLPLTYSQERVWLIQQRHPDTVAYNFEAGIRFFGDLDTGILQRCLREVVNRHEVYRSTFHFEEGRPVQRVHKEGRPVAGYTSLEHLGREEAYRYIEEWRLKRVPVPYHPDRLPLIEWHTYRISPGEHYLLHREHHLLHDGWSFFIMMRDLLSLYGAAVRDTPATLPDLPYQIADFADAQRRWVAGGGADAQREFWQRRLSGCPELLALPYDHPRPALPSMRGGSIRFELLPVSIDRIREFSRTCGTTPFMVLVSVFALLMGRYSGMRDICFGSGVANRRHHESEGIIGMIINNLVIRLDLSPDRTFGDLLMQTREVVLDALANQDLPFDQMVALSGVKSNESYPPVCQVLFSSYDGPLYESAAGGLQVETELVLPVNAAKFDLNVILITQPTGVRDPAKRDKTTMIWEYATDLFDADTISQMSRHYLTLLARVMDDPGTLIESIQMLEPYEREQYIARSMGPIRPYPATTIASVWRDRVSQSPDRVALESGDRAWTYRELDSWANRIAHRLADEGAVRGSVVGCCMPRGAGAIAAIIGTLKAGGAYLPMNPGDPDERIRYLAADSGISVMITDPGRAARLSSLLEAVPVVEIGEMRDRPDTDPRIPGVGNDLACIMYTSGSTGTPKGVEVLHKGILRLVIGTDYTSFGEEQRVLQLAPLSFDASSFEIWGALLHGGTLVIYPDDIPDPALLEDTIRDRGISTMWLNASLFNHIIDTRPLALAPLRELLIGGEPLSAAHVRRAYALLPGISLVNGYGPTENTTFTCCYRIPRDLPESVTSIPIGRPIANTRVYVLDDRHEPVPRGVTGELYLGGDGVARGYRGQPGTTADLFIPDPFAGSPGAVLYRSGDLGAWNKDGTLQFRGRADRQVKIRGFRIEPAEIEAEICRIPHVRECVVAPARDPDDTARLVAYLVMDDGHPLDAERIRSALREQIPGYMIPNYFVGLDRLPLGGTGKLDFQGLPRAEATAREWPLMAFCKYRSMHEVIVRELFEELLQTKDIGPEDDFFDKGGHSLQLLKLASRIYEVFGVQIDIRLLFPSPTVKRVCEAIAHAESGSPPADRGDTLPCVVAIKRHGSKPPVFLVPGGTGDDFSLAMYGRLAVFLPDDRPMYGFRTRDADERWLVPCGSVEEMASAFVCAIRRIQPQGPYNIVGGCIGGVIAYEVARQLAMSGQEVERLVLLESWPPDFTGYLRMVRRNWCTRARFLMEDNLLRGAPMGRLGKFTNRIAPGMRGTLIERGPEIYSWIQATLPWEWEDIPNELRPEWSTFHRMVLRYRPGPYEGNAVVIESEDSFRKGVSNAWRPFVKGELTAVFVPGNHLTYLTERIRDVGRAFGALFDEKYVK